MEVSKTQRWKEISDDLAQGFRNILRENLIGIYLTGSAALDDWYEGKSDIDFTAVVDKQIKQSNVSELNNLLKTLEKRYRKVRLEIQYIPLNILGKCKDEVKPILAYSDKKHSMSYFNYNPVTWFTLMKYGIVVYGREISELNLHTTEEVLMDYVYENTNTYWAKWVSNSEKLFSEKGILSLTNWGIEWCVCGLSRMYYTFREKDITSKSGAIKYMFNVAPEQYHLVLQEALSMRINNRSQYHSKFKRRKEMIDYAKYVLSLFDN